MTSYTTVKSHQRRKPETPPDPLSSSFPSTRERIAKLREDIRRAQEEPIPVLDSVTAKKVEPEARRWPSWVWRW